MADVPQYQVSKELQLTAGFQTLYTVNNARWFRATCFHLVNVTASARTVRLCVVPPAGAASAVNALLWDFSVPANDFIEFGEGLKVPPASTIQVMASAISALNLFLSGVEEALIGV